MRYSALFLLAWTFSINAENTSLLTDINKISRYWGSASPYVENSGDIFGVEYTGLPAGCQIESAHTLQRHSERFPHYYKDRDQPLSRFSRKISNFTDTNSNKSFEGILSFLNSWQIIFVSDEQPLTAIGAANQFAAGVNFWNQYGRILYNTSNGQVAYDPNFPNGTARPPVVLRTTDQPRMQHSQINWALGFFGSSSQRKPNPYKVVIIPEELDGIWNNTLASYKSCPNFHKPGMHVGKNILKSYIPGYLSQATKRLQNFAPDGFSLTTEDVYAMQYLCAYETALIGASSFCKLFSEQEWAGFEYYADLKFYYAFHYGNPTARAQGIGYVQEMFARLNHSLIYSSSSSVNSTLDSGSATFPTTQAFYADFTHDTVLVSVLAALSIDYFRETQNITQFSPGSDRKFILSQIVPFGARLITETIGCNSPNPRPRRFPSIYYSAGQDGYDLSTATHKFVRLRLNNGILPLNTIRGGLCGDDKTGRIDGMCALKDFMRNQENMTALANYQYVCFADYTIDDLFTGRDRDGTTFP